ncbi:hypothetical protein [Deinococcus humi]|uniref:HTH HARE-type domain-containing protein n=1 Tax=Deinococcus humi TaxID=662880 RepID=A0A7W8JYU7_9DEIO|nr:hypothetical protein [Deinococcus humi]MBB5365736.1 hypothetical protein [Deinococcus humi]GGO38407.1 hypothetical protein GCM10008949_44880 [Deinococcus humi]
MKHAWQYVLKAAKTLHAQGQATFSPQQIVEVALGLGWAGKPQTVQHHVCNQMRADISNAPYPYLDYLGSATYRLNEEGKRAAEGL